ncbi:MAG: BrxA family protein [Gammaproteobacteria bacterium]|jgi:hypothetical protein
MEITKITSQLKKVPFFYNKSKMIARWILEGEDKHQIYQKCVSDNKIEIKSFERRREITNHLYQRLLTLDHTLIKYFLELDIITAKFILLYAVSKHDTLFTEFLFEVYRNALLSEKKYISMDDFNVFFTTKGETNYYVGRWSNTTIELLSKSYRKMLVDSSLGVRKVKNIYVNQLVVHPEVSKYIDQIGDYKYLQAILGDK